MAKTEYFYKKYCKICSKLTDTWKISEQYFSFLRRSPGMKFPEDKPNVITYDCVCNECSPEYYSDPNWVAPEPFKKIALPIPKKPIISASVPAVPTSAALSAPSIAPAPSVPSAPASPAAPVAPPVPQVGPRRPPAPPRMAAPIARLSAPPAATPQEPDKISTPTNDTKQVVKLAVPRFKIPPIIKK